MPIYEYKCKHCGRRFEVEQKITDAPLERCDFCHQPVERVIGSVGVVFKGSGFYVTDSQKKKRKGRKKKEHGKDHHASGSEHETGKQGPDLSK